MKHRSIKNMVIAAFMGGIVGAILAITIIFFIQTSVYKSPEIFGNVADWISGIGSIVAIIFVYIQIKASQKQMDEQIKASKEQLNIQMDSERENVFQQQRPLFKILKISNISMGGMVDISHDVKSYIHSDTTVFSFANDFKNEISEEIYSKKIGYYDKIFYCFQIRNFSENRMMAVKISLYYQKIQNFEKEVKHSFYIDIIKPDETINIMDNWLFDRNDDKLKKITVTFNTNMRELLNLIFYIDEENMPVYSRKGSYVENKDKGKKEPVQDYDLNNFKESELV